VFFNCFLTVPYRYIVVSAVSRGLPLLALARTPTADGCDALVLRVRVRARALKHKYI
jgi:hypothetical protein